MENSHQRETTLSSFSINQNWFSTSNRINFFKVFSNTSL